MTAATLLLSIVAMASPAKPGRIVYTQPDGSTIGIYLHGDEYYHWMTDDNGNIVADDGTGFITKQDQTALTRRKTMIEQARTKRQENMAIMKAASSNNLGAPEIPVLLIGFSGSNNQIKNTQAQFDAMLNTPGYSDNGAVGSVYDYYNENSFGQFKPHFDVLPIVNLSGNVSTYGNNDSNAYQALLEACTELDSKVDFSKYDNDGDGVIDFIIFYFGGYDEAQCPQTSAYTNYIWSHASDLRSLGRKVDGKTIGKYFCTSELKGYTGSTMCSIGTTCHEFAHTLGLPDFYDAGFQEGESNTESANMYYFDLMASGSYNVDSTTPPYLNAEELMEIGWLPSIPEITSTGSYSLPSINYQGATSYSAYMTKTSTANEYFVYETRGGTRWDAGIPAGLLVYHLDRSTNRISGTTTAISTWTSNRVNSHASHPCCYVVPASNPTDTDLYTGSLRSMLFGSTYKSFSPTDWKGKSTGFQFSSITYSNGVTTFNAANSNSLGITGTVMNSDGNPIPGVTVSLSASSEIQSVRKQESGPIFSLAKKLFVSKKRTALMTKADSPQTTTTDNNGFYSFDLDEAGNYEVTASMDGYISQTAVVSVTSVIETQDFYLWREGEELPSTIIPFPEDQDAYVIGFGLNTLAAQNLFPVSEMAKFAGKQIKEISFYLYGDSSTTFDDVYAILDYDSNRKATVRVNDEDVTINGWTTVDLRDEELVIPSKQDIYAGVGINNWQPGEKASDGNTYYYAFVANYLTEEDDNGNVFVPDWADGWPYAGYASELNLTSTGERYDQEAVFWVYLTVGDYEAPDTGYNFIADPKIGKYSSGDVFDLVLKETSGDRKPASSVEWYFDDEPVPGTSITLPSGSHVIEARFTTAGGNKKVVELELEVD